jgi:hypothetical protein
MSLNTAAASSKGSLGGCKFHLRYVCRVCEQDKKKHPVLFRLIVAQGSQFYTQEQSLSKLYR